MIKSFDLTEQYKKLEKKINSKVLEVLASGNYILGDNVKFFEKKINDYLGSKYSVSCNSGTDALILSLRALGIEKDDEVITTPFTYFASSEAISLVGAKPVFADINPHTFNINPKNIKKMINRKTKAILSVNIFGQTCKLDEINTLAKEYNIAHVEDCAQSFGATHNNKQSGTYGEFGCFSFFPTKNLGCFGDGGLITVKNKKAYNLLLKLRTHGGIKRNQHDVIGYNSRLDELQAAILTVKLPYINKFIENRRSIAKMYFKLINNDKIILPFVDKNSKHTFNQFTLRVKNRNKFEKHLKQHKIPYGIYYSKPIYKYKAYEVYKYNSMPMVEKISKECISIPIYPELKTNDIKMICNVINEY